MEYLENIEELKKFMNLKNNAMYLNDKLDNLSFILSEIESNFKYMSENDDPIDLTKIPCDMQKSILSFLEFLRMIYLRESFSVDFSNFCIKFSLLVHNWNENTVKNSDIKTWSEIIQRFYMNHLTSLEVIDIMKLTLEQLKQYNVYALPSIELSKQYLKSFEGPCK